MAELHAEIHRCTAPAGLPSLRERIATRIDNADSPASDKQNARHRLADLPDGTALCHGDFHPGNVLVTPCGLVAIDRGSASRGDPTGDVARTPRLTDREPAALVARFDAPALELPAIRDAPLLPEA